MDATTLTDRSMCKNTKTNLRRAVAEAGGSRRWSAMQHAPLWIGRNRLPMPIPVCCLRRSLSQPCGQSTSCSMWHADVCLSHRYPADPSSSFGRVWQCPGRHRSPSRSGGAPSKWETSSPAMVPQNDEEQSNRRAEGGREGGAAPRARAAKSAPHNAFYSCLLWKR